LKEKTQVYPFSILPHDEQKKLFNCFSYEKADKNTILADQEFTEIKKIYILSKGLAKYYYRLDHTKILKGELKPGNNFGGLSLLFNNGVSIRSLEVCENSSFMTLDAGTFLSLCRSYPEFLDYFACEFGRCMTKPSFAEIMTRQIKINSFALPFFNRPIRSIFTPNISTCTQDSSIYTAAKKMAGSGTDAVLIKKDPRNITGIVTDSDFRKKLGSHNPDLSEPVSQIMSSPVISISADSQVFDAFLSMTANNRYHLGVKSQSGDITGIISGKDLIVSQMESASLLIKNIQSANSISDLEDIHSRMEKMLLAPVQNGADPDYITRLISGFSDAIIDKIIRFSIDKAGPAPCRFVFLTMGSEGREEQTLISDQDNAIIFEDCENTAQAKQYFDKLAELICNQLNTAGYRFCEGNNMAMNPEWCQPLSKWKEYFNTWIRTSNPENLLHSSIFFDFRGTWGHLDLADQLKQFLMNSIENWSGFLRNLTENTLYFKPPLTRFGKFIVETKGRLKGSLDIKIALLPIIDFARVYALKNGITQTNTLARLFRLSARHALTPKEYTDIVAAYNYMMRLRFLRQITAIMDEEKQPDNYIFPHSLSSFDQIMLKEIFKMTEKLQQKLSIEFTGVM
jgi:CBS domain-containing protein